MAIIKRGDKYGVRVWVDGRHRGLARSQRGEKRSAPRRTRHRCRCFEDEAAQPRTTEMSQFAGGSGGVGRKSAADSAEVGHNGSHDVGCGAPPGRR